MDEITTVPRSSKESNARLKALLLHTPKPNPTLDRHQTAVRIHDDNEDDDDDELIEADLYNSAKEDKDSVFIDVLERVSKSKKMSISAIFKSVSLSGDTLLHVAASNGNADIVEMIITHFPSLLNKVNCIGDTAVHVAAKTGKLSVLQVINSKRHEFSNSNMNSTIYCGLANRKVPWRDESLKVRNKEGNYPLHEALINGHENLAVELVKQEQDGSVSFLLNKEDKSAVYLAAEGGYIDCLQLMMNYGTIHQNQIGKSPIHSAIWEKHTGVLEIMLMKQPNLINLKDEEGRTSLHFAAWLGYEDGIRYKYLIRKNSRNATKRDKNGQLPIHLASMNDHINVIEQLLQHHYNPHELLNEKGQNILHVAAESGEYEVVVHILKHQELNLLINKKDHDGNMPLHLATMRSHPKIVSALTWDDRVDLHSSNNKLMTALDVAKFYMEGPPTILQRLTWLSLKASGASHFSSGKILLNAGRQSKQPNIDNNTDKQQPSSSSVDPKLPSTNNYTDWVGTLLLVSTLISTITFSAGFTMAGGYNDSEPDVGIATMLKHHMFHLFIFCDTIAMFTSLAVVVLLIWAQLGDINLRSTALNFAVPLLGIALIMMSLAFIAGVYLTVSTLKWLAIGLLIMSLVLLILVLLLFFALVVPFTSKYRFCRYITFYFICIVNS